MDQARTKRSACGFAEQLSPWFAARSIGPNEIFVGNVILPGTPERHRAFVKVFPIGNRRRLVFNECFAHQVAIQCELPSPLTFPCACDAALIRSQKPGVGVPEDGSSYVLGVASIDGKHKSLKQVGGAFAAKWADIMNWPQVARAAVFDELMGNDDRHIENLIRVGPHDYVLIDNERILFGEDWSERDLHEYIARRCDANVLADTIAEATDEVMRQRMVYTAQNFVRQKLLFVPDVSESIEHVCQMPAGTTARLIEMLNRRRAILPTLMQWHMQKGDLFRASTNR